MGCAQPTPTPTPTFTATETNTPVVFTPTESPTATGTPTATATGTPMPTAMPTAYPTCLPTATLAPTATPNVGDMIVRSCLDNDGNEQCDQPIVGIEATVCFEYQGTPPWAVCFDVPASGIVISIGEPSGLYYVKVVSYGDQQAGYPDACLVPYYSNDEWCMLSHGQQCIVLMRFWRQEANCGTLGPTPTRTATPQATHPCPNFSVNCQSGATCPAETVPDPLGRCQQGFVCCLPVTPTPLAALGDLPVMLVGDTPGGLPADWAGRPETRGWCSGLREIRGLRDGRELRLAGDPCPVMPTAIP